MNPSSDRKLSLFQKHNFILHYAIIANVFNAFAIDELWLKVSQLAIHATLQCFVC